MIACSLTKFRVIGPSGHRLESFTEGAGLRTVSARTSVPAGATTFPSARARTLLSAACLSAGLLIRWSKGRGEGDVPPLPSDFGSRRCRPAPLPSQVPARRPGPPVPCRTASGASTLAPREARLPPCRPSAGPCARHAARQSPKSWRSSPSRSDGLRRLAITARSSLRPEHGCRR